MSIRPWDTETRPAVRLARTLGLALLLSVPAVRAQESEPFSLLGEVVSALRDEDPESLAALVDFDLRSQEGLFRGRDRVGYADLDALDRLTLVQETVSAWLDDDPAFLRGCVLYDFRRLQDPDAGNGPAPDRVVLQGVLRSPRHGSLRDLLLTATAAGRLLDLELGPSYAPGLNPAGPQGLLPLAVLSEDELGVRWPDSVDHHDRREAEELVDMLLSSDKKRERDLAAEALQRSPRGAASALVKRLVELEEAKPRDTSSQALLVEALETITGRPSRFSANVPYGTDEGSWQLANHQEVLSWVRWHAQHGGSFAAAEVLDPLRPTHSERPARNGPHSSTSEPTAGAEPAELASAPGAPGAGTSSAMPPVAAGAEASPAGPSPGGTAPDAGAQSSGPKVTLRVPEAPAAAAAADPAANLRLLIVPSLQVGPPETRPWTQIVDALQPGVRQLLRDWAPALEALQLSVAVGSQADYVVLARTSESYQVTACRQLDQTLELLKPVLPPSTGTPVVAILFDQTAQRSPFWKQLIDELLKREIITLDGAVALRSEARGFTARARGVFVQPVYDMAGDASAGDDEFRLANELVHKLAQVSTAQRAGLLPDSVLWALGHLAEIRLHNSVYQFNKDGFVSVGDHFDWPAQAARALEKRSKRRNFSLADRVATAAEVSNSLEGPMIAWATLDYLYTQRPEELAVFIDDLSLLQRSAAPRGGEAKYVGDPLRTQAAFEHRLGRLELSEILAHLERAR